MRRAYIAALVLLVAGCREPDLTPVRKDIAASAEVACAAPAPRPAHLKSTREVTGPEIEGAIVMLCLQAPGVDPSADAFTTIHEGLAQPTPVVGAVRKSRLILDAPRVDFSKLGTSDEAIATVERATAETGAASSSCRPSWTVLGRTMIDSAKALAKAGKNADALARCTDVIALGRDEHLAGDLTNAVFAQGTVQIAAKECEAIVDGASKEEAQREAPVLALVRAAFPATLEAVVRRDRSEMNVVNLSPLRDPAFPFPCTRAEELAKINGEKTLKRAERVALVEAWTEAQTKPLGYERHTEEYTKTLKLIDALVARARRR